MNLVVRIKRDRSKIEALKKIAIDENDIDDIDGILNSFAELLVYKCVDIVELNGYQTEEILCRYFGIDY